MHIGGLYTALISEKLAHQTNGIFYLRIEDTDKKREVEGAADLIVESLENFNIKTDEGQTVHGNEVGIYAPYKQSERSLIYKAHIKFLLEKGLAYPCFCSSEEIEEIRKGQESKNIRPGYYGDWAKWRNKSEDEVLRAIKNGKKFVIRFKLNGNNTIELQDVVKGRKEMPENDQDIVIMKSDGLPTYHMAHVIDDHLMGTTHVIRGDEWLNSTSLHLQLFEAMGWKPPQYGHLAPIQKIEGSSKRKLSKRKDPEASVTYYEKQGYPENAVIEYLLNLANSNFEDWRKENPSKENREFKLTFNKLAGSTGALFDFKKLNYISKEIISKLSGDEVYEATLEWSRKNDKEFAELLTKNSEYAKDILSIERDSVDEKNRRKDIAKWSDVKSCIDYFFDENFNLKEEEITTLFSGFDVTDAKSIVASFIKKHEQKNSKDKWLEIMKDITIKHRYAESNSLFKAEPTKYKGHLADVAKIFRILLTGKIQTPDLYSIMQVMGNDRVKKRLVAIDTL
jgi:glutamyl-tRNA synthetase